MKALQKHSFVLASLAMALLLPAMTHGYESERVVIVSIDGLRATEAFEERPWDFIPLMWDSLRPQGLLYPSMYNLGATWTTPGHAQMFSGQWEFQPNSGNCAYYSRPLYPTVFEYYNNALNPGEHDTYIVAGKWNLKMLTHSLNPAYGAKDSTSFVILPSDGEVYEEAARIMNLHDPHLLLIHMGDVDWSGHRGPWDFHISKIAKVDTLVYRIWNTLIQRPGSPYEDRTTMMVTTDHGRHSNTHGGLIFKEGKYTYHPGYREHGCFCHGCQRLFLLALGPDTPEGVICDRRVHQVDICPTVAEVFDLPAPYSDATVLWEMLGQELPVPIVQRQDPQLAINDGIFHAVWREKGPATGGLGAIYYSRQTIGERWSIPVRVSSFVDTADASANASVEAFHPSLLVDGSNVDIAWSYQIFHDGSGSWEVWHRRSTNAGVSWPQTERLVSYSETAKDTLFSRAWSWRPHVMAWADTMGVFYARHRYGVGYRMSATGGAGWPDSPPLRLVPGDESRDFAQHVKATYDENSPRRLHVVWNDIRTGSHNLYYQRSWSESATWLASDMALTAYEGDAQVSDFDIALDESMLHILVADNRDTGGSNKVFQIYHTSSAFRDGNPRITWHRVSRSHLLGDRPGAIDPALVVAGHDTLYAAWADHRDGNFEIYASRSVDAGGTWSTPTRETATPGFSVQPRLAFDEANRHVYLIYQDNTRGSWEIPDIQDITYDLDTQPAVDE